MKGLELEESRVLLLWYQESRPDAKGKGIPRFLILHVADRPDAKAQAQRFAAKLKGAGVATKVVAAEDTNHGTINANLGKSGDRATQEMFRFLIVVLKR